MNEEEFKVFLCRVAVSLEGLLTTMNAYLHEEHGLSIPPVPSTSPAIGPGVRPEDLARPPIGELVPTLPNPSPAPALDKTKEQPGKRRRRRRCQSCNKLGFWGDAFCPKCPELPNVTHKDGGPHSFQATND